MQVTNASLSPATAEIMRQLNAMNKEPLGAGLMERKYRAAAKRLQNEVTTLHQHLSGFKRHIEIDDRDSRLDSVYNNLIQSFMSQVVNPISEREVFSRVVRTVPYVDQSCTTSAPVMDLLSRIFNEMWP
jgi:hypothetical protein